MSFPNYFLADLPPDAPLTECMIREACRTLKRNRNTYLAERPTPSVIRTLCTAAENLLHPAYPIRKLALSGAGERSPFSEVNIASGLDRCLRQFTEENLQSWIYQDLGHIQRLDEPVGSEPERDGRRSSMAAGPELLVQMAHAHEPARLIVRMAAALLARSAQFIKCRPKTSFLPRLFAHAVYDVEPKFGACLELAEWAESRSDLNECLYKESDCVLAEAPEKELSQLRERLPIGSRFIGHPVKVGFAVVTRDVLQGFGVDKLIRGVAADVSAWDQLSGSSPHAVFVQNGSAPNAESFAELLSEQLAEIAKDNPLGSVPPKAAKALATRRKFYRIRAESSHDTRQWCSGEEPGWTVVYETDPRFQLSCGYRFVHVKPFDDLEQILHAAEESRHRISTVGVAASATDIGAIVKRLAAWGIDRVCPIGKMQDPPIAGRHGGRPCLSDLITFTEWEI